jgi:hypothetical protein
MKTLICFIAAVFLALSSTSVPGQADPGDSLWAHPYGGPINDFAFAVEPAGDGNYLLAGVTNGDYESRGDLWLLKVTAQGDLLWSCLYDGGGFDCANDLISAGDGNFLIAGQTTSFGLGQGVWLLKVNPQGDTLWTHTYYGGYAWAITPAGDGGFLMIGSVDRFGTGLDDMLLIKVNAQGDSLWSHFYGGPNSDYGLGIAPADDGGFLLVGYSNSFGSTGYDMRLVKVNSQGDSLWARSYGGIYPDQAWAVAPDGEGNFMVAGMKTSATLGDVWLVKVNNQGDSLWSRTYGGSGYEWADAIITAGDGGFLLAGLTNSFGAGWYDVYLVKVNHQGDELWSQTYGGPAWDEAYAITLTEDGDILLAGKTYSFGAGWYDMWLVRAEGSSTPAVSITLVPSGTTTIPPAGGGFNFNATVLNHSSTPQTLQTWIMVRLPNQTWYGPVLGPISLTLASGSSVTRLRTQTVPGSAPPGNYWYEGRIGNYPNAVWDTSGFAFTKLGSGVQNPGLGEWLCTGNPFPGEISVEQQIYPSTFILLPSMPNPFNASTTLSYELPAANYVSLKVYDTTGRLISTLVDGMREAGAHAVTFDGTRLASGIYLATLESGEFTAVQKLVLMK